MSKFFINLRAMYPLLLFHLFRVKSRCVEILFKRPKVGPITVKYRHNRTALENGMTTEFLSILSWIVGLEMEIDADGIKSVEKILEELQTWPCFAAEQRLCNGWAILLYFTELVSVQSLCVL